MNIIKTYQVELSQTELTEIRELLDIQMDEAETKSATAAARGTQSQMDEWGAEVERINDLAMIFSDLSVEVVEHRHPDANAPATSDAVARERDAEAAQDVAHAAELKDGGHKDVRSMDFSELSMGQGCPECEMAYSFFYGMQFHKSDCPNS